MTKNEVLEQLDEVWSLLAKIKENQLILKNSDVKEIINEVEKTQFLTRQATFKVLTLREELVKM